MVTAQSRLRRIVKDYARHKFLFVLLLPGLAAIILFQYVPMYGIVMGFQNFKIKQGILGSEWVGFQHFIRIFNNARTLNAFMNSLYISLYSFAVGFPATIIFALLLNEIRHMKTKKFFQSLSYLPFFLSWVVVSTFVTKMLSSQRFVNTSLTFLGLSKVQFMIEPVWFKTILVFSGLWKGIGWGSVIYMAAISGTSAEQYEAAMIDGANRFQRVLHVTFPAISHVVTIVLIFSFSGLFGGGDFEQIMNLVNEQTLRAGENISTLTYSLGIEQLQFSLSTAFGFLNSVIAVILLTLANQIAKRFTEYTIW